MVPKLSGRVPVRVPPSPSSSWCSRKQIELSWSLTGAGRYPAEIVVTDITGKEVLREHHELLGDGGTRTGTLPLGLGTIASGEYHVAVYVGGRVAVRQFVLVR